MRILVADNRGYVGAMIVSFLQRASHEAGLDAGWYDGCDFGLPPSGHEQRTEDIRDVQPDELVGVDAVANLAAISQDPVGDLNPKPTYSMNADGEYVPEQRLQPADVARLVLGAISLGENSQWTELHCPAVVQTKRSEDRKSPMAG